MKWLYSHDTVSGIRMWHFFPPDIMVVPQSLRFLESSTGISSTPPRLRLPARDSGIFFTPGVMFTSP
jgi:hypothetical protein